MVNETKIFNNMLAGIREVFFRFGLSSEGYDIKPSEVRSSRTAIMIMSSVAKIKRAAWTLTLRVSQECTRRECSG